MTQRPSDLPIGEPPHDAPSLPERLPPGDTPFPIQDPPTNPDQPGLPEPDPTPNPDTPRLPDPVPVPSPM